MAGPGAGATTPASPARVVSLNVCLDPILVALLPRERIAALTTLAADPAVSPVAREVMGLPLTHGEAEEVLDRDPDLVLAGPWGASAAVDLLRRLGRRVEVVPMADSLAGIAETIRAVAAAVGEPARGARLIADVEAALSAAGPRDTAPDPAAIVVHPNGLVSPPRSLIGETLAHAGLDNLARRLPVLRGDRVALESLVLARPEVLVLGAPPTGQRSISYDNLRHPALRALMKRSVLVDIPAPLWLCGGPAIGAAVARLARARIDALAARALAPVSPR